MSLSANTVWEVRGDGDDGNGGGFVAGASGTDRSQQAAAHAVLTTLSTVHTTTSQINVHASDYTVTADDVGNILQITGGTATPSFYEITSVDVGNNRWTLDRSAGSSGQTVVGKMGGALGTPGKLSSLTPTTVAASGQQAWIKAANYTLATSTPGPGGPCVAPNLISFSIEGYNTTRGDREGRPVLDAGAVTGVTLWSGQGNAGQSFIHLAADGQGNASVNGFLISNLRWTAIDCTAVDCVVGFTLASTSPNVLASFAGGCQTGFSAGIATACWADQCGTGITSIAGANACVVSNSTGEGIVLASNGATALYCTSVGNGSHGFRGSGTGCTYISCLSTDNGGYGFNTQSTHILSRCASFNNSSGRLNATPVKDDHAAILTADPFVSAGSDDYRPNDVSGGGAELRNAGTDVFGQIDNVDIGAIQHAGSAGRPNLLRRLQALSGASINA